jgi:DNA-binding beta-propeller fold protein YncE
MWRVAPGKRELASGLDALSLVAGQGAVWAAGTTGVTRLDAVTGAELDSSPIGESAFTQAASIALGGSAIWFGASSGGKIFELDPQTLASKGSSQVGRAPVGISVDGEAVWVANSGDGTVSRVDPASDTSREIRIGQAPGGIVAAYGLVWTSPGEARS